MTPFRLDKRAIRPMRFFQALGVSLLFLGLAAGPTLAGDVPFPTKHIVAAGFDGATSVHAVDFDGDGDLDLIGAAHEADTITVWENTNGLGSAWDDHVVTGSYDGAISVQAADIDGDGDVDVLAAAEVADDITWWENDGTWPDDGTGWTPRNIWWEFYGVRSVHAADLDNDGDVDVLGACGECDAFSWFENDGTPLNGGWTEHVIYSGSWSDGASSISAADTNDDGYLDVLGAAADGDSVTEHVNDGSPADGGWQTHSLTPYNSDGAASIHPADMDGDGDPDYLLAAEVDNDVTWVENLDVPPWNQGHPVNLEFLGAKAVSAADMDGDGDQDLLAAARTAGDIAWWENTGACTGDGYICDNWPMHVVDATFAGASDVDAADMDGDGDLDLIGAADSADEIAWWENKTIHRSASFPNPAGEHLVSGSFDVAVDVDAADLDADGDLDLIGASGAFPSGRLTWWENSAGTAWSEHLIGAFNGARSARAVDVNRDGDLDVLGIDYYDDEIAWWENDGSPGDGGWVKHLITDAIIFGTQAEAADMDGDGDMDVVSVAQTSETFYGPTWWENGDGAGTSWIQHDVLPATPHDIDRLRLVDVDGDGAMDIAGSSSDEHFVAWWRNNAGTGLSWTRVPFEASDGGDAVYAADMDGDGDADILGELSDDGIAWWEQPADPVYGTWTKHILDDTMTEVQDAYALDLDADGDMDVIAADWDADNIVWWENTGACAGACTNWPKRIVEDAFDGVSAARAGDLDGDGAPDIFGAAAYADSITWWENRGGQFALPTTDTSPDALGDSGTDDLLKIVATHRGRVTDSDEALVALELLFEESAGDPLTDAQANAIIETLAIYLDDGSGSFEAGSDAAVATVNTLALTAGVQTVTFADDDPNVRIAWGDPRTYFVVVTMVPDVALQADLDQFRVVHLTASTSRAEDQAHDIALTLEYADDVVSGSVPMPRTRTWDGGGSTDNWSEAANWDSDSIAPRSIDRVRFDDTSDKRSAVDADTTVARLTIASGYDGKVTSAVVSLTVIGDFSQADGSFEGAGSNDKVLNIGGAFTLTGGAFTAPTGLMRVGGGFHHTGGTFDPYGGRVVLDNATDQVLATTFHDLYLNDGLLGYWKLDNGPAGYTADSSGYGHTGTLYGDTAWTTDVPDTDFANSLALTFDGDGDDVWFPGVRVTRINDLQRFTLAAWVKLDALGGADQDFVRLYNEKAVLRNDDAGPGQLHFYATIGGSLREVRANNVLSPGAWLHVAGTYDGATLRAYVNGAEVGSLAVAGTVAAGSGVELGDDLDGSLDDVRVYGRALAAAEIGELAAGGHPSTTIAATSLGAPLDVNGDLVLNSGTLAQPPVVGYWKLDEGSGAAAADASASGYDGTLVGDTAWSSDVPPTHFANARSLSFDGSGDYVDIPGTPVLDDLQRFTLATWVKLDTMGSHDQRLVWLRGEKAVLRSENAGPGQLHFYVKIDGELREIRVDSALSTGTWLHVAGSYDGATLRAYVNGAEVGSLAAAGTVAAGAGAQLSSASDPLDGLLDDARVYDRALSAAEIWGLANGLDVRTQPITVGGDLQHNGGVFEAGDGAVTLDGSGAQVVDSLGMTFYHLTVNSSSAAEVVEARDPLVVAGLLHVQDGMLVSGSDLHDVQVDAGAALELARDITVSGDWTCAGAFAHNDHAVTFDGSGTQTFAGATIFKDVTIVDGSSTLQLASGADFGLAGTLMMNDNFDTRTDAPTTTRITGAGVATFSTPNPIKLHHLVIDLGATLLKPYGIGLQVAGNWTNNGTFDANGGLVTMDGAGTQTLNGATTFHHLSIGSEATLALNADIGLTGDWSNYGSFVHNSRTVTFSGAERQIISWPTTFYDLTIANTSVDQKVEVNHPLVVEHLLLVQDGTLESGSDYHHVQIEPAGRLELTADVTVSGDWTDNGGRLTSAGHRVTFDAAGTQTFSGRTIFHNVTVAAGSTLRLATDAILGFTGAIVPTGSLDTQSNAPNTVLAAGSGARALPDITYHHLAINDGLLGYWPLDDGAGTVVADESGYGHHGVLAYTPTWSTATPFGFPFPNSHVLQFIRANSDYVEIANTTDIDDLQQFTLAAWVRLDSMGAGDQRFITLRGEKAVLRYDDAELGQLDFYVKIDGVLQHLRVNNFLSTQLWIPIAATYDGTTMRVYYSGQEVGSLAVSGTVGAGSGVRLSAPGDGLDGWLDDVRIYNRALTAAEIQSLALPDHPNTSVMTATPPASTRVNGDLVLSSGTLNATGQISVAGDVVRNGGVFAANDSTVTLDGGALQTMDSYGMTFHRLAVRKPSADGVVQAPGIVLPVTGELQMEQGRLKATLDVHDVDMAATATLDLLGDCRISGNWQNAAGVIVANGYDVIFDGSTGQTLAGSTIFPDLTIANTSATAKVDAGTSTLAVSNLLHVQDGTFASSSDLHHVQVDGGATFELNDDITVSGDWTNAGLFTSNGHAVTFDGATVQALGCPVPTQFSDLAVSVGTTLVETEAANNVSVQGALTNAGTIRKTLAVSGTGMKIFGLTRAKIDVITQGSLVSLQVDRIDRDHPQATGDPGGYGTRSGVYWTITSAGSGYTVTPYLPHSLGAYHSDAEICRWAGAAWDCGRSGSDTGFVWRAGVTELSDWTLGKPAPGIPLYGPGWNMFGYPLATAQPVPDALASIDGYYQTVYGYEADDAVDPWKVYDVDVPSWVNDLDELVFGHGYWITVTQDLTLNFGATVAGLAFQAGPAMPAPPATYYGLVQPGPGTTPAPGLPVEAWVGDSLCGQGETLILDEGIGYTVNVAAEDASMPGCGVSGRAVAFRIAGQEMAPVPGWNNNRVWEVDLALRARWRLHLPLVAR